MKIINILAVLVVLTLIVIVGIYFSGDTKPVNCVQSNWSTCDPDTRQQTRTTSTPTSNGGASCGPLTQACYIPFENTDYSAYNLSDGKIVKDRNECQSMCDTNTDCNAYVHGSDNSCYLKKLEAGSLPNRNTSFTTYYKGSYPLTAHTEKDYVDYPSTAYHGYDINYTKKDTLEDCKNECDSTAQCNSVLYLASGQDCYTKKLTSESNGVYDEKFITSYKGNHLSNIKKAISM